MGCGSSFKDYDPREYGEYKYAYGNDRPMAQSTGDEIAHSNSSSLGYSSALEPFKFTHFYKQQEVGRGAYGVVSVGVTEKGIRIAVKEVSLQTHDFALHKERLNGELRVLRRIPAHPNLVKFFKVTTTGYQFNIWMEYCPGGSVCGRYRAIGPIPLIEAAMYTRDSLHGLHYLHSQGILHRDIKCDNILLDGTGTAKLADFGAATEELESTLHKTCIGTVFWSAPEMHTNKGYRSTADIWSLGCAILEMVMGEPPFAYKFPAQGQYIVFLMSQDVVELPEDLDDRVKHVLRSCLDKNPENRPSASALLGSEFVKLAPFVPLPSVPPLLRLSQRETSVSSSLSLTVPSTQQVGLPVCPTLPLPPQTVELPGAML
eukprot:TRINITY_DN2264_c0_g1_i1.p1 TRINITY_DN2264_c0_g1~~TRINITY_DN2264_c0_g1_i1.p1  ORF type:complete len:381 (+),score=47.20 TRINITY_DN2264_c0_g1_i1:25-1143(+)